MKLPISVFLLHLLERCMGSGDFWVLRLNTAMLENPSMLKLWIDSSVAAHDELKSNAFSTLWNTQKT